MQMDSEISITERKPPQSVYNRILLFVWSNLPVILLWKFKKKKIQFFFSGFQAYKSVKFLF